MKLGIAARLWENKYYVNSSYIEYFTELGFSVEILTDASSLEGYDGFILPGGYDIDPKYYQEENTLSSNIVAYNDRLDFKIIAYAERNNQGLLGICRGIQSINVYFGGSLYQDIAKHMDNNHFILFQGKYILVNSFHHQSIKTLGKDMEVLAVSCDQQIEIIRHKHKKIIGVQFHPERMNTPIIQSLILDFFTEA